MATSILNTYPAATGSLGELEIIIKMALKKTGSMKEFDLCPYLSDDDRLFLPSTYLKLKDTDQRTLMSLIREKILDRDPFKTPDKVQNAAATSPYAGQSLEGSIKEAMAKLNVLRETALCKYIPCEVGYLHHFTFLKMKSANPIQLRNLIKEHILDRTPKLVTPKKRNRRPSKEFPGDFSASRYSARDNLGGIAQPDYQEISQSRQCNQRMFENDQPCLQRKGLGDSQTSDNSKIDQLLSIMSHLVQSVQYKNSPRMIHSPQNEEYKDDSYHGHIRARYLQVIQNQLIKKIRSKQADEELWEIFLELIK